MKLKKLPAGALYIILSFSAFMLLLILPVPAADGVREGLRLSARVVVPSVFPFLIAGSFFVRSGAARTVGKFLSPLTKLIFRLPEEAGGVVFASMIAGYPVGARMTAELYAQGGITAAQAKRMMLFCINPGPAFTVGAVGLSMLGSRRAGIILYACVCFSCVFVGFLTRFFDVPEVKEVSRPVPEICSVSQTFVDSVSSGASGAFAIAAWVTLFGCISSLLGNVIHSPEALISAKCLFEVTGGCYALAQSAPMPAVAAALGWSGFCVCFQVISNAREVGCGFMPLLVGRALCGGVSAIACRAVLQFFPDSVSAALVGAQNFTASMCCVSFPAAAGLFIMCLIMILDNERKVC